MIALHGYMYGRSEFQKLCHVLIIPGRPNHAMQRSHNANVGTLCVTIMIPDKQEIQLAGLVTCLDNVSSCAGHLRHNGFIGAAPGIQQAALAHIGPPHQSHLHRANKMPGLSHNNNPWYGFVRVLES